MRFHLPFTMSLAVLTCVTLFPLPLHAKKGTVAPLAQPDMNILPVDPSGRIKDAFTTIQSAVDAAKPGDVIEITGGIYFEHVVIKNSGKEGSPITIQSAPNQAVLINAGRKLVIDLKPVPGLPEVFVGSVPADFEPDQVGIWETPSRLRLARVASPAQVARRLASWSYDAEAKKLYIRSSGAAPANEVGLWLESTDKAAVTVTASHIRLRHLEATLGQHGFLLQGKISHVTLEDSRAFCNSWAGIHLTGDNHLIQRNETFQNNTYGIQLRYGVNQNIVRDNICYINGPNNGEATGSSVPTDLGLYSQGGYNLFEGNIVDGIHEESYRNKTGHGASQSNVFRRNVVRGSLTTGPYGTYDNTFIVSALGMRNGMYRNGGKPNPMRSWDRVDPTGLHRSWNLIYPLAQEKDPSFADPAYRDFRLQGDTPYLGMGAYPGRYPIFYVNPKAGSDENSGLSAKQAFASPKRALSAAAAGSTIYLLPGEYKERVEIPVGGLDGANPLRIRAYGKQAGVRLTGGIQVAKAQHVVIDGLEIADQPLDADSVTGLIVKNTLFTGANSGISAIKSGELAIDRCTFDGAASAVRLKESPRAAVANTLFANCKSVYDTDAASAANLYSDFNAYSRFAGTAGGTPVDTLAAWQSASKSDGASLEMDLRLASDLATPASGPLARSGSDFGPLGARQKSQVSQLDIANLRVAGLAPTVATLLWDTPKQSTFCEITLKEREGKVIRKWEPSFVLQINGEQFDVTGFNPAFYSSDRHAVIPNLEPGKKYSISLVSIDLQGNRSAGVKLDFETPTKETKATTYYVSPTGKDSDKGNSRQNAWGTFSHALSQLHPGDELVLLPGTYREILRPRVSGTPERPVRIRSEKPQEAIIEAGTGMPVAVEVLNTNHIEIDGLFLSGAAGMKGDYYTVNHANGITIRNCEVAYPTGSTFEKLKLGYSGLIANEAPNLRVENNLFLCCAVGVGASNAPGTIIRGNTFIGEGNYGVVIVPGGADEQYTVENNLFYRTTMGYKTNPSIWIFEPMPKLTSNYNLFYIPEKSKATVGKLPSTDRLGPLSAWQATGFDQSSHFATPEFENPEKHVFVLKAGSPGKGQASDGGDIGRRK